MPRVRARSARSSGRLGGRGYAKVTTPRRVTAAVTTPTLNGRGKCPHCREMKPLLPNGRLRGHTMYGVTCLGYHKFPLPV